MFYNKTIETLPSSQITKTPKRTPRRTRQSTLQESSFLQKQFDEAGIKLSKIKGVKDLHKLPFTKKTDLRDNYPFDLFAVPQNQVVRIHASSGTTGKPTVVGYNRKDLRIFDEVVARSLVAAGAKKE